MYYIVRTEVEPKKCELGNKQRNLFYYFATCQSAVLGVWLMQSNLVIKRYGAIHKRRRNILGGRGVSNSDVARY